PLIVENNDGVFIRSQDPLADEGEGIELSVQRIGAGSDATLAFCEAFDGATKGFRFFMDGSPPNQAYLDLYRHYDAGGGVDGIARVFRITRQEAGIQFNEQVRIPMGTSN